MGWESYYYVFVITSSMMMIIDDTMLGYPMVGFMVVIGYWTVFLSGGFLSYFQTKLCRIFDRCPSDGLSLIIILICRSLGFHFSNRFWYWCMTYEFLRGISRNRDPPKDMRWLLYIRPSGQGVTFNILLLVEFAKIMWHKR